MTPSRFEQIERIYQAALKLGPKERSAYLAGACGDDGELRREVEALLTEENAPADSTLTMVGVGTKLGPYKIEASIGKGGMGEVFRALDTRLGRKVAIKVSGKQFDERFEREARAISALNHPHICTLYDVGSNYLVMELVEGETLAARLKKGKFSISDTLKYGAQIADALAEAHSKGITHRDLKPGNVMLAKIGVKVLDFGLAKSQSDATMTASNVVMGTPAYMAPEQFAGKDADARTDIYALGLVLYEMAMGKRAVQGHMLLMQDLPPQLAHLIERCLAQDPEERWQTAKDVRAVLDWAARPQMTDQVSTVPRVKGRRWAWVAVAVAVVGLISGGYWAMRRSAPGASERSARFNLSFGEQAAPNSMPIPSPDGQYFVFETGNAQSGKALMLRPLDSTEARMIPGTEGADAPFWSPDGLWIGFYAAGKLKKISPTGGPARTIANLPAVQEAAWGSNGDIIYRPSNRMPLFRISEGGGSQAPLTQLDKSRSENSHRGLSFLPDGRKFLFTARCSDRANNALYIGSLDTGRTKRLMPIESSARYIHQEEGRPGALVYYRDGALVARRFDPDREELSGESVPVLDGVEYNPTSVGAAFRISANGRLAVIRLKGASDTQLTWFGRNGEPAGMLGARGDYLQPRISPDGTRVAVMQPDPQTGNRDIFLIEIARGVQSRLTTHVANDWFPVWSPDGKQILFGSDRDGGTENVSYLKASLDPAGAESKFPGVEPVDWSLDGRWIILGNGDIFVAPATPVAKPFVYLATPFRETSGRFSPDVKWLAYVSDESGRPEVYVRPFSGGPAVPEGKIQISNGGGDFPVWNPDGRELYFMDANGTINAVNTATFGRSQNLAFPAKLFRACENRRIVLAPITGQSYASSFGTHDGKRFLVNCTVEPPGQFTVLLNWPFTGKP